MTDAPFTRRALIVVIAVGLTSFALAVGLAVFGDDRGAPSAGPDSYSRSAVGHRAFVALLRRLDVPVAVSRHDSSARAGKGLLVLAEPRLDDAAPLRALAAAADRVLVVLPKWHGVEDPERRAWIVRADLHDAADVQHVLEAAGAAGTLVRVATPTWQSDPAPTLAPAQLIRGGDLEPVIAASEGILVGRKGKLWILADPDLIANHGLGRGDNAVVADALIEQARDGGAVVFDETLHGYVAVPSLWRELFTFPLSLLPLSALLAILALLWSAVARFGARVPAPAGLAAGKLTLIDNIAELLRFGGHAKPALERYLQIVLLDVARRTHAPAEVEPRAWIAQLERARGVGAGLDVLERAARDVPPTAALAVAARIHQWRQEIIDGSVHDPGR